MPPNSEPYVETTQLSDTFARETSFPQSPFPALFKQIVFGGLYARRPRGPGVSSDSDIPTWWSLPPGVADQDQDMDIENV